MINNEYFVSKDGNDSNDGSQKHPFLTINKAASITKAGDTVTVHEGVYRESVNPINKGYSDKRRIVYQSAENEKVIIKGSEVVKDWENIEGTIWKKVISNDFFGNFNPFSEVLNGDWLLYETTERKHLGDIYLNGMSFYEVSSYEKVLNPSVRTQTVDDWTQKTVKIINPNQTKYVWYAEVNEKYTSIYANFHEFNPNNELVEINVRKNCFFPEKTGRDYITVKGFEMAQAATQWAPPTADQPALLGVNWSKGWIIENNILHDSKCSAISIGKEESTGHNYYTSILDKPGYQYQLESVFSALRKGWRKETIGSHLINNNIIYNCGQNAIVGHLGCVFSKITNNHIYNIGVKREVYGHEIAGIKLHAAIDVEIVNNRIHDCSLGTWLDWQTQGTKVSSNIYYKNSRDLFVEVSHGPYVIDHNIFASEVEMDNFAQGGAYINNLFMSNIKSAQVLDRSTPYHLENSTEVAGFAVTFTGDDRYYGNVFIGDEENTTGTSFFNGYTTSMTEYIETVQANAPGDHEIFADVHQPVYINKNLYLNGAMPFKKEVDNLVLADFNPNISIIEENESVFLEGDFPPEINSILANVQTTDTLPSTRITKLDFKNPEGNKLVLNTDFLGDVKDNESIVGPISTVKPGKNKIKIW